MGEFLDYYIINKKTVMLIPWKDEKAKRRYTRVVEVDREVIVRQCPYVIMKRSRRGYGMRAPFVKKLERDLFPNQRKIPYVVSISKCLIMVQTCSPRHVDECCYVSFRHVSDVKVQKGGTKIMFKSGRVHKVNCSKEVINKILQKALLMYGHGMRLYQDV